RLAALPFREVSVSLRQDAAMRKATMQDVAPAFVLLSEARISQSMNAQPPNPAEEPSSSAESGFSQGSAEAAPREDRVSDEHLILPFPQGSAVAFPNLFPRYKQPIYGFFRRRTPEPAQAEELTQEAFLVLLRSAVRYEPRALFRTYLYTIAFRIL